MYKYQSLYSDWALSKTKALDSEPEIFFLDSFSNFSLNHQTNINKSLNDFNFFVYQIDDSVISFENQLNEFGDLLGLSSLDNHLCASEDKVTKIFNDVSQSKSFYIPYTDKPINWHTDGYYNIDIQAVYAFILHCGNPAYEGGQNGLLDQDQVFIHLINENPLYVKALMSPTVMTIPENKQDGVVIRPETSTAIFNVLNEQHHILMRYSMRKKNIVFAEDPLTQEALSCMDEFINAKSSPYIDIKLKAGQGVACNNVLHRRTSFKDKIGSERLYYRARYYNRISINV